MYAYGATIHSNSEDDLMNRSGRVYEESTSKMGQSMTVARYITFLLLVIYL